MFRRKQDTSVNLNKGKKVFVGLSGGVDSAVSAALLKAQGYDVTGVFIKVWQPDFLPCTWREERRDAMRVALSLGIPFLFLDLSAEYKMRVADVFIEEYRAGRTPNPDILCNKEIKFGVFLKKARELGADFIATGHYAQKQEVSGEKYELREGRDKAKDQSYFLWTMTQSDLSQVLFPIGGFEKSEVRRLAHKFDLPVSEKKDSQGICFLGDVDMEEFLSHFIDSKPGAVLNTSGEVVGSHRGAIFYTIGERHGFEIDKKGPNTGAYYVVSKDLKRNTITVSNEEQEIISLSLRKVILSQVNWLNEPDRALPLTARIRYRGEKLPLEFDQESKIASFDKPARGLSLGQSLVFYQGDECLGGGVIDREVSE